MKHYTLLIVLYTIEQNRIMLTLLIIAFLFHLITGKDTTYLLEKIKVLKLERKFLHVLLKIKNLFLRCARFLVSQILRFFFIMTTKQTPILDKLLIIGGLLYVIDRVDLLPYRIFGFVGYLDDIAIIVLLFFIIKMDITPIIDEKTHKVIQHHFGFRKSACTVEN